MHKIFHVIVGIFRGGAVIKHKDNARYGEDDEEQECNSSHAPSIPKIRAVARDTYRMEMQENVVKHLQCAVALIILPIVTKDRFPYLVLRYFPPDFLHIRFGEKEFIRRFAHKKIENNPIKYAGCYTLMEAPGLSHSPFS